MPQIRIPYEIYKATGGYFIVEDDDPSFPGEVVVHYLRPIRRGGQFPHNHDWTKIKELPPDPLAPPGFRGPTILYKCKKCHMTATPTGELMVYNPNER